MSGAVPLLSLQCLRGVGRDDLPLTFLYITLLGKYITTRRGLSIQVSCM